MKFLRLVILAFLLVANVRAQPPGGEPPGGEEPPGPDPLEQPAPVDEPPAAPVAEPPAAPVDEPPAAPVADTPVDDPTVDEPTVDDPTVDEPGGTPDDTVAEPVDTVDDTPVDEPIADEPGDTPDQPGDTVAVVTTPSVTAISTTPQVATTPSATTTSTSTATGDGTTTTDSPTSTLTEGPTTTTDSPTTDGSGGGGGTPPTGGGGGGGTTDTGGDDVPGDTSATIGDVVLPVEEDLIGTRKGDLQWATYQCGGTPALGIYDFADGASDTLAEGEGYIGCGIDLPINEVFANKLFSTELGTLSDGRYKTQVTVKSEWEAAGALAALERVKFHTYRWKHGDDRSVDSRKEHFGVLADELKKEFPEAVFESSADGEKALYVNVPTLLFKTMQATQRLYQMVREQQQEEGAKESERRPSRGSSFQDFLHWVTGTR
ncbi:unnamed protein product [Vitrella brassicaformis CCMP3155]|uniref:Peptidase S74 domain-containing protein n=1 Tax=Vitrella brassicaformis (strain CCMP3155) TaxID=1169540 RepID=A0A0G4FHP0_VITBC|nr:unnamed protein product [Vitrella brassicaformis CCMP3155]|eukprot:CEM12505.1 unnamed protein product [Vitrella brassicaformis CCMP3155]